MTLTLSDVERLEKAGFRDFLRPGAEGRLHLRRVSGHCLFLRDGGCVVYAWRPEGCVLYPLVLDVASDAVVLDDFCPLRAEFSFAAEDHARLRRSVADEEREGARRLESTRSGSYNRGCAHGGGQGSRRAREDLT